MLTVYTRHLKGCEHRNDSRWRRCHCPKWIRGLLLTGEKIRRTEQTSNWENAEKLARQLETNFDPNKPPEPKPAETTLREAVEVFLADQTARGLVKESKKKYRTLLERQLLTWADKNKIKFLKRIRPGDLIKFRGSWGNGETTTHRKHEMLMSFFKFCQRNDFIAKNPMEALKKPKTPDVVPTDYFRRDEFDKIVAATSRYEYGGGNDCHLRGVRLLALTLLNALGRALDSRRNQARTQPPVEK